MSDRKLTHFDFTKEMLEEMLTPGYISMEIGYRRLPDGDMYAATYIQMPHCTGEMVEWWFGSFLHIVRDTYYGCEMRNRFWVIEPDESTVRGMIKHNLEEMGNLAEILPRLYCSHK